LRIRSISAGFCSAGLIRWQTRESRCLKWSRASRTFRGRSSCRAIRCSVLSTRIDEGLEERCLWSHRNKIIRLSPAWHRRQLDWSGNVIAACEERSLSAEAGQGTAAPCPAPPSSLVAAYLRFAPDAGYRFRLTKLNTFLTIKKPEPICSDGVHIRPGMLFSFPPEWCAALSFLLLAIEAKLSVRIGSNSGLCF
jgi:hypothetical protein